MSCTAAVPASAAIGQRRPRILWTGGALTAPKGATNTQAGFPWRALAVPGCPWATSPPHALANPALARIEAQQNPRLPTESCKRSSSTQSSDGKGKRSLCWYLDASVDVIRHQQSSASSPRGAAGSAACAAVGQAVFCPGRGRPKSENPKNTRVKYWPTRPTTSNHRTPHHHTTAEC